MAELKPDGGRAFPKPDLYIPHLSDIGYNHDGMTMRQYYAAHAIPGVMAEQAAKRPGRFDRGPMSNEILAEQVLAIADAICEREQREREAK